MAKKQSNRHLLFISLLSGLILVLLVIKIPAIQAGGIGTPTNLAYNTSGSDVILTWDPVVGADSYTITGANVCATINTADDTPQATLGDVTDVWGDYSVAAVDGGITGTHSIPLSIISTDAYIVVDNDTAGDCANGSAYAESGNWLQSGLLGHDGLPTRYSQNTGSTATWTSPLLPATGRYEVEVWYPNNGSSSLNANYMATYVDDRESDDSAHELMVVNQRNTGGEWRRLGAWNFNVGESAEIQVERIASGGVVRVDAVRFRYTGTTGPTELLMDNLDSTGVITEGTWTSSTYVRSGYENFSFYADDAFTDSTDGTTSVISYTPSIATTGHYKVLVRWTAWGWGDRADNVPVEINYDGGTYSTTVDQNDNGGVWVPFGTYLFNSGSAGSVVISNEGTTAGRQVTADAVRFELANSVDLSENAGVYGDAGETISYTMTITNIGTLSDTYTIALTDTWGATAPATISLDGLTSGTFDVEVTVPGGATGGDSDVIEVAVTSDSVGSVVDSADLTTTVPNYGVVLSEDDGIRGELNEVVTYTVTLTNTGDLADTFTIGVSDNWGATAPASMSLAAGASDTFNVEVTIPGGATDEESDVATVTATSQSNGSATDSVDLTTTANIPVYGVALSQDEGMSGDPGAVISYTVTVTNTGDTLDTFAIAISDTWGATAPASVMLDAGLSTTFAVEVMVPVNAGSGDSDIAEVTVTSQGDGAVTDSVELTTTANTVYGISLSGDAALNGGPGDVVTYTVTVTNTGNIVDSYDIAISDTWGASAPVSVTVNAGVSNTIDVAVSVPSDANVGDDDVAQVTVTFTI